MKPKVILPILLALSVVAVIAAVMVGRNLAPGLPPGATAYQVGGEIRGLNPAEKTVRIAHDEIPGYMPAMVMPLTVKDARLLAGLCVGDRVSFELIVTDDDSWISRITRLSGQPSPAGETAAAAAPAADEADRVMKGEAMPDFSLIDQDGRSVRLRDLRGKAVIVTFIYTRCPLPNFCPLMSKNFADLQTRLSKKAPGRYQLVSITMDPAFDQPEVLREYASRYDAAKDWKFATGTPEQINEVATALGLQYQWENGLISHDLRTALIGPDGRLVHLWKSNVWTPYEVERMTLEVIGKQPALAAR